MADSAMLASGEYVQLGSRLGRVVAPNPGPMTGSGTNTYVLSRDWKNGPVTLIDPGPAIDQHVETLLELFGDRIESIVVTHTHSDHSPAAAPLAKATGAKIYGATPAPDAAYQDETFSADFELNDDQRLKFDGVGLRAIHTPGHVNNHYCFLVEDDGIVLTGDHLMNGSTVVIIPPAGVMKDYIESLEKIKNYPVKQFGPGHGDLMDHPIEIIDWTVQHRLSREQKVIEKLAAIGSASLEELTPAVYDDVDPSLHFMASMSLWAHLIKLETEGRVQHRNDVWDMV
ncbi:MAG: MBL fold metallo-hydrolase [Pseudomonadales bacterium]